MIDNLELVLPLLKVDSPDDFYYLQILSRKKDNPALPSNSRVIKNYYIKSANYLISRYDEIKTLCNVFNARASIRLNKRSYEKTALKTMVNIANSLTNNAPEFIKDSYDRACGACHNDSNKKWIVDLDGEWDVNAIAELTNFIDSLRPTQTKSIACIPSKSGFHLITSPFDISEFQKNILYKDIDIHKDNPTNLYIP